MDFQKGEKIKPFIFPFSIKKGQKFAEPFDCSGTRITARVTAI